MRSGARDIHRISMPWYVYKHKNCLGMLWVPPFLLCIGYWAWGKAARAWSLPLINIVPRVRKIVAASLTPVCIHGICERRLHLLYVHRHICIVTKTAQYLHSGLLSIHSSVGIICAVPNGWMFVKCDTGKFKCKENPRLVKIGKINGHFAWRHEYNVMFPATFIHHESVVFIWNVSDF